MFKETATYNDSHNDFHHNTQSKESLDNLFQRSQSNAQILAVSHHSVLRDVVVE